VRGRHRENEHACWQILEYVVTGSTGENIEQGLKLRIMVSVKVFLLRAIVL